MTGARRGEVSPTVSPTDGLPDEHVHGDAHAVAAEASAYQRAARLFHAAGDPERLRLLVELTVGERCVTELAEVTAANMSTVSQRLRVLRDAGLVERRRHGKHLHYFLADDHVRDLVHNAVTHADEL